MPDNVTAPATGIIFASDDIGGVQWPYAKLSFGPADTANIIDDAAGKRLPVLATLATGQSVGITGTLPAFAATPTFNIGTAPTLAVSGTVAANAGTGTFAISAASLPLPTGAATETTLAAVNAKLGSLGQKAMAGSAPVVLASDQSALPTYADNFAKTVASNTITRLANTTAYAAGQLIGGSATVGFTSNGLTFTGVARSAGGVVRIERARLYKSQATALGTFELRLYRAQPTITIGDAGLVSTGVPVGNASSTARLVARFAFDMTTGAVGSDGVELAALTTTGAPVTLTLPGGASDLFAVLVATGAYTPASGETFSVILEGYAF